MSQIYSIRGYSQRKSQWPTTCYWYYNLNNIRNYSKCIKENKLIIIISLSGDPDR